MRHGGRQSDPPQPRRQRGQPRHAQRQLVAALGAGERVDLVHHHACQAGEHLRRIGQRQQHREALRRGQQDVRRLGALARAAVGGRVAGARLDADRQAHLLHRPQQVAGDVGGQRLQRADIQRVQAGTRGFGEIDQGGQEAGQRLAAAGGGDQQHALAGARRVQHGELVRPRGPALAGEPRGKAFRQCSLHGRVVVGTPRRREAKVRGVAGPRGGSEANCARTRLNNSSTHANGIPLCWHHSLHPPPDSGRSRRSATTAVAEAKRGDTHSQFVAAGQPRRGHDEGATGSVAPTVWLSGCGYHADFSKPAQMLG